MAQIQLDKEKGLERFNEYRKTMFPWVETAKKRDDDMHKQLLERAVKSGPLVITASGKNKNEIKSRMVQRVQRASPADAKAEIRKQNELYKRLGKTVPV